MASIRRTDIMHNKGFSKGRPAKSERERNRKRQEAYRWRDARRIYLANSFDRWRKLRCSLGMKDSVLAWHLMEAHEKGQCGICRRNVVEDNPETIEEDQAFLPLLIKSLRKICYSQFHFEECIKVVGLLCLEFDNSRKENFSVNETILAKFKHLNSDRSITPQSHLYSIESSSKSTEISDKENSKVKSTCLTRLPCHTVETESLVSALSEKELPKMHLEPEHSGSRINTGQELPFQNRSNHKVHEPSMDEEMTVSIPCHIQTTTPVLEIEKVTNKNENISGSTFDPTSCIESEAEVSLEIDVEKIDTSQDVEESLSHQSIIETSENRDCEGELEYTQRTCPSPDRGLPGEVKYVEEHPVSSEPHIARMELPLVTSEQCYNPSIPLNAELPLDMSLEKPDSNSKGEENVQNVETSYHTELCKELSMDKTLYLELKAKEVRESSLSDQPHIQTKRVSATPPKSCGRLKEDIHPSIPWQRRDMSRKEEYEFLELNPFSDLSEFSQRYPHVHQRTYYRWKRRIKEEYIILEQCPHMSFEQFSSVVLQAKESVFNLWKSFIAQGKGFFAPSDASKRLEAKCPTPKSVNTLSEQYTFLQKNLSCTQEQFCQKFVNTSPEVFVTLKRKVLQEFWVFYHNQHLDWKEFCKLVDVSEEVFNSWRDHISRDIKSVMNCFSSNAQMVSPHYPAFQSGNDPQAQLLKANMPTFDSSLEDSVATSLSASYLNSVQNMMFPWSSYYGVHSPLNQQMLPMMLWPRMMGMNGNSTNPLALSSVMASSPSSCGTKSESPHRVSTSATHSTLQPLIGLPDPQNIKIEQTMTYNQTRDTEEADFQGVKRSSSQVNESEVPVESDYSKKQKVKEEMDNLNTQSPVSKSRKQNKQEYIYYLKNPSLNFKDLESLFPTISLRTFYRWRKEMNAALLFLQEKKDSDYQQFKLVFPDIPEDVFELWRMKLGKESIAEKILIDNDHRSEENFGRFSKSEEIKEMSISSEGNEELQHSHEPDNRDFPVFGETPPAKKQFRAAHVFIHQNPHVDFASFSQMFPNISARSFYRWKKDWKDAIEFLQANPGIDYERYKSIDSSTTEEIFEAWKRFSFDVNTENKRDTVHCSPPDQSNADSNQEQYSVRKLSIREFAYVQLHPQVEFHQFHEMFPYVPSDTFYQWKKEIHKIINYVRSQPSVCFEEISAVLPDVTEEAFLRWKEIIAVEKPVEEVKSEDTDHPVCEEEKSNLLKDHPSPLQHNEEAKAKMTNALLHLMHNPNIEYQVFSQQFEFVSFETFELWLHRIKAVILHISSNPGLDFEEFRTAVTDIGEDIFKKWKSLSPAQISAIGYQNLESKNSPDKSSRAKALFFCQENPDITYEEFSAHYFHISQTDFKCWMLKISTQISFIRDNKSLTFEDFSGIYPDVEKAIFDLWKKLALKAEILPHFLEPSLEDKNVRRGTGFDLSPTVRQDNLFAKEDHNIKDSSFLNSATTSVEKAPNQISSTDDTFDKDQESSLKKLAKLAESHASYNFGWNSKSVDTSSCTDDVCSSAMSNQPLSPSAEYAYECNQNNNNNNNLDSNEFVGGYHNHYQSSDSTPMTLPSSFMSSPMSDGLNGKVDKGKEFYDAVPLTQENQSLSALMVMSADHHKFPPVSSTPKMEKNSEALSNSFSSSGKWKYSSAAVNLKDEDEMFSSQRQKKMSRAEYLFVKDNPDVDSQEFARIFPGVSARTFYRWKKEIKAQMQIA